VIVFAPAKINLALHVTGQRADGYHLLESVVVFAKVGDRLTIEPSLEDDLAFSGPFGDSLQTDAATNLVLKARDAMRGVARLKGLPCPPVSLHLEKNLPLSSGIGGGSADATAAIRALNDLWALGMSEAELMALGLQLGADVPMCIAGRPLIASGIGDVITPISHMQALSLVLVNPSVGVSTPQIFRALSSKANGPLPELTPSADWDVSDVIAYLSSTRNDLELPASLICPAISDVLNSLMQSGALLARMSGSGATCFGIYDNDSAAQAAAAAIAKARPDWWVA
jgi:4-diphosphocytidyl-2-C-methyl-D-erythritol kinase